MGIIPRVMGRIFELIEQASESLEFSIKVSMLEIYNEKIQDLLNPVNNNLKIKESKLAGVYVDECTEIYVSSAEEMKKVMFTGSQNRTIAATRMNERSSRSHSIFIVTINQKDLSNGTAKLSRIYFVDLAGSEKVAKTDVKGKQLEEAKNINKSLTALGMVINTLAEGKKGAHIPYRDSKLTRLLQDSLGGNSLTTLLIAASMCSYNDKETVSTLRFGQRAKAIKNKPKENVERSARELMLLLEASEKKVKKFEELVEVLRQRGVRFEEFEDLIAEGAKDQTKPEEKEVEDSKDTDATLDQGELDLLGSDLKPEPAQPLLSVPLAETSFTEADLLGLVAPPPAPDPQAPKEKPLPPGLRLIKSKQPSPSPAQQPQPGAQIDERAFEELRRKCKKQEESITDLKETVELIQTEMEDLTIENMDLKEKYDALVKGGINMITKYHRELVRASSAIEQVSLKAQKNWIAFNSIVATIDDLKDFMAEAADKLEADPKLSKLPLPAELLLSAKNKLLHNVQLNQLTIPFFLEAIAQQVDSLFHCADTGLLSVQLNPNSLFPKLDDSLMNLSKSISLYEQSFMFEISAQHPCEQPQQELLMVSLLDQMKGDSEKLHSESIKNMQANYQTVLTEKLEQFNREVFQREETIRQLTSQKHDLTQELERLRGQVERLAEAERLRQDDENRKDLGASVLDEDAEKILKRINRYRRERDAAEQSMRDLRLRMVQAEDRLAVEAEKSGLLRKELRELSEELSRSRGELPFTFGVKTLRGGSKFSPHGQAVPNLFSCESDDILGDFEIKESLPQLETESDPEEDPGDPAGLPFYEAWEQPVSGPALQKTPSKPRQPGDVPHLATHALQVKGFNLAELHDESGLRLKELSARSKTQSGKKSLLQSSVKGLFKSVKGLFGQESNK